MAEIAQAVLFLASEKFSYMVGALMRVDGGLSIPYFDGVNKESLSSATYNNVAFYQTTKSR